jgi:hypothetical protein
MDSILTQESRNQFIKQWSCWEWGIWYWLNPQGFKEFLETGDGNAINLPGTSKPQVTQDMEKLRSIDDSYWN